MTPHRPIPRAAKALAAIVAVTLLVAACGGSEEPQLTSAEPTTTAATDAGIQVSDAWARNSPKVAQAGAVFMTIENPGATDDALVGVSVDPSVAARAEVHETVAVPAEESSDTGAMATDTSGEDTAMGETPSTAPMMTMRPVDRVPVPAGGTVELKPGSYHVMLLELVAPLEVGQKVGVTLEFERAGEVVVTAEVLDPAP